MKRIFENDIHHHNDFFYFYFSFLASFSFLIHCFYLLFWFFFFVTIGIYFFFLWVCYKIKFTAVCLLYWFNLNVMSKNINQKFCDKSLYRCTLFACIILFIFDFISFWIFFYKLIFFVYEYLLPRWISTVNIFYRFNSTLLSAASTINFLLLFICYDHCSSCTIYLVCVRITISCTQNVIIYCYETG